jgi:hypothetical protein
LEAKKPLSLLIPDDSQRQSFPMDSYINEAIDTAIFHKMTNERERARKAVKGAEVYEKCV